RCGNELYRRNRLGLCRLGKFVSVTPHTPPGTGETKAAQSLALGGNACPAQPAARRDAGSGVRGRKGWQGAGAHTQPPTLSRYGGRGEQDTGAPGKLGTPVPARHGGGSGAVRSAVC